MSLTQRPITISVQCGVPEENELMFNVHFANSHTGVVWDVSYRFSQLATLDHDISVHSDKMKEIPFPQIDEKSMLKLSGKAMYKNKLQELNRYRCLMEDWIQCLVSRCHLMTFILYDLVEDWFCLPFGPTDDWKPGRSLSMEQTRLLEFALTTAHQNGRDHSTDSASSLNTLGATPNNRPGMMKMMSNLITGNDSNKNASKLVPVPGLHDSGIFLLKLRVQRGQKGRNGRIEYDIQIEHANKTKSYIVSRSYSVFRRLFDIISRVHTMSTAKINNGGGLSDGGTSNTGNVATSTLNEKGVISVIFPEPPFRCNLGLSLTEANLSYRTRQLDAWLRDVCCCYRYMQEIERAAVRYFLDLDMSKTLDISIQDRLAKGLIEAPRANVYVPTVIRNKDVTEIAETMSEREGSHRDRKASNPVPKASASDVGHSKHAKQALWETSSLASSTLRSTTNSSNIGKGSMFHAKLGLQSGSSLTTDKLQSLQTSLQAQNNKASNLPSGSVKNQYCVVNSHAEEEHKARMSTVHEGDDTGYRGSVDSDSHSIIEDQEMGEDELMRIGMDDKPMSRNKATTDQWVAREFNNTGSNCVIQ